MNNPGSILKLWVLAVKRHEKGKNPKTMAKKGQDHKRNIKNGLTTLKVRGAADMTASDNAERFVLLRNMVAKEMTRYCRYLPAAKEEDKKILPLHLKTVKQLTVLVLNLDPGNLSQAEEEPSLNAVEGVDVAAVDKAIAEPDSGPDLNFDEVLPPTTAPTEDKKQPTDGAAEEYEELYYGLNSTVPFDLDQLEKADPSTASKIRAIVAAAEDHADNGDYEKAFTFLNRAAEAIAQALSSARSRGAAEDIPKGTVAAVKDAFAKARVRWDAALERARTGIQPVQADLAEEYPLAITGLNNVVESYWQDLLTTLQEGQALQNQGDVETAISGALNRIESLKNEVLGDQLFTYLESCGLKVKTSFAQAFDDVAKLIQS